MMKSRSPIQRAAALLAQALFMDVPGSSGETVSVK